MASGLGVLTAQYVGWDAISSISTTLETGHFIANGDAFRMVGWQAAAGERRRAISAMRWTRGRLFSNARPGAPSVMLDTTTMAAIDLLVGLMGDRRFSCTMRSLRQPLDHLALRGTRATRPAGIAH